jgi:DNA-binding CsgD family transcriptional regulator
MVRRLGFVMMMAAAACVTTPGDRGQRASLGVPEAAGEGPTCGPSPSEGVGVGTTIQPFLARNDWWAGTVLSGTPLIGRALTLTYGFVPDGTWLHEVRGCTLDTPGNRCPCTVPLAGGRCPEDPAVDGTNLIRVMTAGPSNLFARMRDFLCTAHNRTPDATPPPDPPPCCSAPDSAAACAPLWQSYIRAAFANWAALSGVRFVEVPSDDGNAGCPGGVCENETQGRPSGFRYMSSEGHDFSGNEPWPGACQPGKTCTIGTPENLLRADIRIGGRAFSANYAGWTQFPFRGGDIVLDTTDVQTLPPEAVPTESYRCRGTVADPSGSGAPYDPQCAMGQWLLHDGRASVTSNPFAIRNTPLERLRHLAGHEIGHSLGIVHPCPSSGDIQRVEEPDCPDCIPYLPANGPSQLAQQRLIIGAFLPKRFRTTVSFRRRWSRIAAHVTAAMRLRAAGPLSPGAIFLPTGEIDSLDEAARAHLPRLQAAVLDRERALSRRMLASPEEALELWPALVCGRWSLVDWRTRNGGRRIAALPNAPPSGRELPLSMLEQSTAALIAMGHSNKLAAYELGVPEGTVASVIHRLRRKLGAGARADLVLACAALGKAHDPLAAGPPRENESRAGLSLLTPAEREVSRLAARGLSDAAIAARRGRALRTTQNLLASAYRKLGVGSRAELAVRLLALGKGSA